MMHSMIQNNFHTIMNLELCTCPDIINFICLFVTQRVQQRFTTMTIKCSKLIDTIQQKKEYNTVNKVCVIALAIYIVDFGVADN